MNDNVLKVKNELWRICKNSELTKMERYELALKQKGLLDKLELKLLVKELHRDYEVCDRLKDLVEVITAFFNGIIILVTIFGVFNKGVGAGSVQYGVVLLFIGFYVTFGVMAIWSIHWHRTRKLDRIQYVLDVLEE